MSSLTELGYVISAVLFILGIKGLGKPRTAVRGNLMGSLGMLLAVLVTLADQQVISYWWIAAGLAIGTSVGLLFALRVEMTSMPQLVALFNGFGGLASVLVAGASFIEAVDDGADDTQLAVAAALTLIIGSVTFTGSVIAFAKLQGIMATGAVGTGFLRPATGLLAAIAIGLGAAMVNDGANNLWLWLLIAVGAALGLSLVLPIGGGDMPVVIALLNSLSGLAASATGFVLSNPVLIIAGSLVGASGLILTMVMCTGMNRTLFNVMFGGIAPVGDGGNDDEIYAGKIRSTNADEVALMLDSAAKVIIVPGYGLAVAQAQHAVRELTKLLEANGTEVSFAIHPVAGRMPGHMNVLLAEAEVDYDQLVEMDVANPQFAQTDVAIVLGGNDVVNPLAREDGSPISGMPILDADKARTVVVIKRSLSAGFAGIPNPLFAADNALMFFADGKVAISDINRALREL